MATATDTLVFDPPVIAHRGASKTAPENTLVAFNQALDDGALWVETDVKLTADGIAILMHDDTLNRTTSGHGAVAETEWADMRQLDAGHWFNPAFHNTPIPLLTDALKLMQTRNLRLNLELKPCPGRARVTAMVALIEMAMLWPNENPPLLISSFDAESLAVAAQLHPECPRGVLLDGWDDTWPSQVKATQASAIHPAAASLTKDRVASLKEANLPLLAYVVNDVTRAKELLHWGITAVFSDCPGELIKGL